MEVDISQLEKRVFLLEEIAKVPAASFTNEDKLLALSRALGAVIAKMGIAKLSVKMIDCAGNHVWVDLPASQLDEFVRWG